MEQFEEVEVVKALKKHIEKMKDLIDKQYKASQALDTLFKYKTNKLNVNTVRDIDQFTDDVLDVPFLSEQIINSLGEVFQNNKKEIEKQLEIYVKKLDMNLSTGTFDQSEVGITLVVDENVIGHATANVLAKQAFEEAKLNAYSFNDTNKMPNIPSGASKKDEEYKKLQEEHEKLKHMYKVDTNHQSELIENATRERDSAKEYAASLESKLYSLRKDKENLEKVLNKYKNGNDL